MKDASLVHPALANHKVQWPNHLINLCDVKLTSIREQSFMAKHQI